MATVQRRIAFDAGFRRGTFGICANSLPCFAKTASEHAYAVTEGLRWTRPMNIDHLADGVNGSRVVHLGGLAFSLERIDAAT
jgi:hypothetical protein